jgi:hypothetical protein
MSTESKLLSLLQVVVPPDTQVSVASEIRILEILGIVSTPALVKAMQLSAALVPAGTAATLKGLVHLLSALMRMHPKTTRAHHSTMDELLAGLEAAPDVALTFGTFLPVCDTLLKAAESRR